MIMISLQFTHSYEEAGGVTDVYFNGSRHFYRNPFADEYGTAGVALSGGWALRMSGCGVSTAGPEQPGRAAGTVLAFQAFDH